MKNAYFIVIGFICACFLAGCMTTGLSTREFGTANYTNYIYGLYDGKSSQGDIEIYGKNRIDIEFPINLAVAQVGENNPPQELLEYFKAQSYLLKEVKGIPAAVSTREQDAGNEYIQNQIHKMRQFAADLGMEYLFLYGGSIDFSDKSGAATVVDWTIIGAYVIPTHKISGIGKGSGAFIDVKKGKVLFIVDAEQFLDDHASTVGSYSKQDEVVENLRRQIIEELGKNLVSKLNDLE